ncbi:MAG: helix-turn-helix domain-containing protein [Bryobacterales bacterium]|nr:helix-turn-helix domain-containing protein [Bryobacterales bacterium]
MLTAENSVISTPSKRNYVQERLLTPSELAEWLGVSAGWVRDHATRKSPKLPTVRLGKLIRFRVSDIEAFLREQGI